MPKGKKPTKKLSPSEKSLAKLQADHRKAVRSIYRSAGFLRLSGVSDKEFTFDNQMTDFDDVFVYENVIIFAEYTCAKESNVGDHLKKKKIVYDKILTQVPKFIAFMKNKFPVCAQQLATNYHTSKLLVKIIYCSRNDFDSHYKENVPGPVYMDYPAVRYFCAVSEAIKLSCRLELLEFLNISMSDVGVSGKIQVSIPSREYRGSILPEAHSNFAEGYKIVTFYADPESLLRTTYVIRKDGWRDSLNLYQRMISHAKIESIRHYLKKEKRVFVNNIIVTLPSDVTPLNEESTTIDASSLTKTAPVIIKLPDRSNSVGLIDGQHRVFAYHETLNDDAEIAQLRMQQNLLVTGIIYPKNASLSEREKFEARLFLEINSTQTSAKSQLKQAIGLVLDPFSSESIAARVLSGLASSGPLAGYIQQYFFEIGKLKTSSIVSFGLKPLVKTSGTDSLFSIWDSAEKLGIAEEENQELLELYISFCVSMINRMLAAVRQNLPPERWDTDPKIEKRVLTTTYVNSFLIALRLLIGQGYSIERETLSKRLVGISDFDFKAYHSSQYARMADEIVKSHFGKQSKTK